MAACVYTTGGATVHVFIVDTTRRDAPCKYLRRRARRRDERPTAAAAAAAAGRVLRTLCRRTAAPGNNRIVTVAAATQRVLCFLRSEAMTQHNPHTAQSVY